MISPRVPGAALLAAVVMAGLTACSSGTAQLSPTPSVSSNPPSASPSGSAWPAEVRKAGYLRPGPDDLGSDPIWVKSLRERVRQLSAGDRDHVPPRTQDITIAVSRDVGQVRYAEVVYPAYRPKDRDTPVWVRLLLLGPAGAAAADLDEVHRTGVSGELVATPMAIFLTYDRSVASDGIAGLVVISAPGAQEVTLTHKSAQTEWTVPAKIGSATWSADLTKGDLTGPGYAVEGRAGANLLSIHWPRR